jgi:hypothetical protein
VSDLLDDLARQMAAPMPRRRALRILLAGAAGATVPGLRAGAAWGRRRSPNCPPGETPCGGVCCDVDWYCADPATSACCSNGRAYCGSGVTATCCEPGEYCANPGEARPLCCPTGSVGCGTTCCPKGATCADPDIELCCKPGAKPCSGGNTVTCCKPHAACCEGRCCGPRHRCHEGECKKCPPYTRVCGNKHCCERGQACCDGQCCDFGETCASVAGSKVCCPRDRVLRTPRGRACCPPGKIAKSGACCPPKGPCDTCDELTCLPGTYCINGSCYRL